MSDSIIWMKVLIESPQKNAKKWSQMDFYTRVLTAVPPTTETILYHELDEGVAFPILGVSVIPIAIEVLNLDLPLYPCKEIHEVQQCQKRCIENILYSRIKCRLPYMNNQTLPECSTPQAFNESFEISKQVMREKQNCSEKCPRTCHEVTITYYGDLFKWGTSEIQLYIRYIDKKVVVVKEYKWYTFNNLVADIGGSFGFFLGVSFLHIFYVLEVLYQRIVCKCVRLLWKNSQPTSSINHTREGRVGNKSSTNQNETNSGIDIAGLDRIFSSRCGRIRKGFWSFIIILCTFFFISNFVNEINDFNEGKPDVKMVPERNSYVKFPIMTFCPYKPFENWVYFNNLKSQYGFEYNLTEEEADALPISELMKLNDNYLMDFWNNSGVTEDILENVDVGCGVFSRMDGDGSVTSKKYTSVKTVFGKCLSINLETPIRFRGTGVLNCMLLKATAESDIDEEFQMFIHNDEDDTRTLDPKIMIPITKGSIGFYTLTVRMKKLYNRPKHPCEDRIKVGKCRSECIDRIFENKTTCRLPFVESRNQKPCETTEGFNQSMEAILAFYKNYSEEWCDCPQKCEEYIYQFTSDGVPFPLPLTVIVLHIPTNLILASIEYYQKTINALIANVCGNLGLYLGFTALTLLELLEFLFNQIKKKKNSGHFLA